MGRQLEPSEVDANVAFEDQIAVLLDDRSDFMGELQRSLRERQSADLESDFKNRNSVRVFTDDNAVEVRKQFDEDALALASRAPVVCFDIPAIAESKGDVVTREDLYRAIQYVRVDASNEFPIIYVDRFIPASDTEQCYEYEIVPPKLLELGINKSSLAFKFGPSADVLTKNEFPNGRLVDPELSPDAQVWSAYEIDHILHTLIEKDEFMAMPVLVCISEADNERNRHDYGSQWQLKVSGFHLGQIDEPVLHSTADKVRMAIALLLEHSSQHIGTLVSTFGTGKSHMLRALLGSLRDQGCHDLSLVTGMTPLVDQDSGLDSKRLIVVDEAAVMRSDDLDSVLEAAETGRKTLLCYPFVEAIQQVVRCKLK